MKEMMKLEDITYRHELIERYLDADTSVEEEQALADFYRHCEEKDLTDEDLDIRNLMLGMENYTPNIHQVEEGDKQLGCPVLCSNINSLV